MFIIFAKMFTQGQENASVWDVMNNNFRMKTTEDIMVKDTAQNVDCALAFKNYGNNAIFRDKEYSKQDQDIEEQMRYHNLALKHYLIYQIL
jgi:hypothetical protein